MSVYAFRSTTNVLLSAGRLVTTDSAAKELKIRALYKSVKVVGRAL